MHDPDMTDPAEVASAVNLLHNAQAATTETLVKMLHPDWANSKVEEEVTQIYSEYGIESPFPDPMQGERERK